MQLTSLDKLNYANIGLMLVSCVLAFVVPFEVFLFAYAVLGPLHYLTEISWLHDRNYFSKGKYDYIILIVIGILLTLTQYSDKLNKYGHNMIYFSFVSAILFMAVKNNWLKFFGILLVLLTSQVANHFFIFLSVFLPTLIHVFVFTGLFILYGSLKSRSVSGMISFVIFLICPIILFTLFRDVSVVDITAYGKNAYQKFEGLNYYIFQVFYDQKFATQADFTNATYYSSVGIVLMRFIAFAYMYHYLNWFSKTSVIKWHEVSKFRLVFVIVLWVISVGLYAFDYGMGFEWLFFLSFLHVLLEFPLNHVSFVGIFTETKNIFKAGSFSLQTNNGSKSTKGKK